MFHIKEDLRAKKSSELLYQGLVQCMAEKEFDKIRIVDITKESTVSRATFYRNFDTIIDILYWKCEQLFKTVLNNYVATTPSLKQPNSLIHYVFSFWMEHTDILEILIAQGRIDIIFNSFLSNANVVMNYISQEIPMSDLNYDYFMATRVGVFVGMFQAWLKGGKKESSDELITILEKQFNLVEDSGFIF